MTNERVAEVFQEMGDLLDIQGGDGFRSRAFRRTATVIQDLREPLARSLQYGRLDKIPGIGPGSVGRIKEILRTGTCAEHVRLTQALPPGLREILNIKRIGPRTVRLVYRHLGIASVAQLEHAARTGMLAKVPGISDKGAADVLLAIEMHRSRAPRQLLPEGSAIGARMVEQLSDEPSVAAAVQVGSARRLKPTVGDLDLVAGSDDRQATVARFCTLPDVERVWMRGDGRASVRLQSGQQMDLWTVAPSSYGAGIAAFTNGIRHNIAIRLRATRMGLHVSEHGVFRDADYAGGGQMGAAVRPCPTERDLYDALGLQLMPPEMREDTGEIEAAEKGALPTLIEMHDLRGDLQVHTSRGVGRASMVEMANAAAAAGREWIAITDRWPTVAEVVNDRFLKQQWLEEREAAQDASGVGILLGVEVDIAEDGQLALDADLLRDLDWVVASVDLEPASPGGQGPPDITERLVRAIESDVVDCIGHPRGRRLLAHEGYPLDLDRVVKAALAHNVVLEVNGVPWRIDLDDVSIRHCRDNGLLLALSSDARGPEELEQLYWARCAARRGWLRPRDVVNALTLEDMRHRGRDRASTVPRARAIDPGEADGPSVEASALLAELSSGIDEAMRERLQAFLTGAPDPELHEALEALGPNALQAAFNLLAVSAGPQVLD